MNGPEVRAAARKPIHAFAAADFDAYFVAAVAKDVPIIAEEPAERVVSKVG